MQYFLEQMQAYDKAHGGRLVDTYGRYICFSPPSPPSSLSLSLSSSPSPSSSSPSILLLSLMGLYASVVINQIIIADAHYPDANDNHWPILRDVDEVRQVTKRREEKRIEKKRKKEKRRREKRGKEKRK